MQYVYKKNCIRFIIPHSLITIHIWLLNAVTNNRYKQKKKPLEKVQFVIHSQYNLHICINIIMVLNCCVILYSVIITEIKCYYTFPANTSRLCL